MTYSKSNQPSGQHKNHQKSDNQSQSSAKGFAAMPHSQVQEIARKGGEARAEQLGHEGYVELGHEGGSAPHTSRGRSSGDQDQRTRDNNHQTRSQRSSTGENESDGRQKTSGSSSTSSRGFASQSKEKTREAASKGGQHSSKNR